MTRGKLLPQITKGTIRSGQLQEELPACAHLQALTLPLSLLVEDVPGFTQKALGLAAWWDEVRLMKTRSVATRCPVVRETAGEGVSREGQLLKPVMLDEPTEGSLTQEGAVFICPVCLPVHPSSVALKRQGGPKDSGPAVWALPCSSWLQTCDPPALRAQGARAQGEGVRNISWGKRAQFYPGREPHHVIGRTP